MMQDRLRALVTNNETLKNQVETLNKQLKIEEQKYVTLRNSNVKLEENNRVLQKKLLEQDNLNKQIKIKEQKCVLLSDSNVKLEEKIQTLQVKMLEYDDKFKSQALTLFSKKRSKPHSLNWGSNKEEHERLLRFKCPITREIMHNPVVAADGFYYEREAIEQWLKPGCMRSPVTGKDLLFRTLTPVPILRQEITAWKKATGFPDEQLQKSYDEIINMLQEQQYDKHNKTRGRLIFREFLDALKFHLEKIGFYKKEIMYTFISYAWEEKEPKNNVLQNALKWLEKDLQWLLKGDYVFLDLSNMECKIKDTMLANINRAKLVLSICTPRLKQRIQDNPSSNIAFEVNLAIQKHNGGSLKLLPILYEGTLKTAVPEPYLSLFGEKNIYQSNFGDSIVNDHVDQEDYNMIRLLVDVIIPHITNLSSDSFYISLKKLFDLKFKNVIQANKNLFFEQHTFEKKSSPIVSPERESKFLQAFERFLLSAKNCGCFKETNSRSILIIHDGLLTTRHNDFLSVLKGHLELIGFNVILMPYDTLQTHQAISKHDAILPLLTPEWKKNEKNPILQYIVEGLNQLRTQPCRPLVYQGGFGSAPKELGAYFLSNLNWDGIAVPLAFNQQDYYKLIAALRPKGIIPSFAKIQDDDSDYQIYFELLEHELEMIEQEEKPDLEQIKQPIPSTPQGARF